VGVREKKVMPFSNVVQDLPELTYILQLWESL